jgi:hypothetical protein
MVLKVSLYIVACMLGLWLNCAGQSRCSLSGYISDAESGELLVGANVSIPSLKSGAITNEFGYYTISLPSDSLSVDFITLGYRKKTITIILNQNKRLDVALVFDNILQELTVTPDDENDRINSTQMGVHRISNQLIQKTTVLLGEGDLLKTIQLLPGVKNGNEGFAGIYIRGGTPDQNLLLLDGVPVYNVNHLFGFLSTFNTDIVRDAVLYKGGIPARYGDRLSSVIDISLRDGNIKENKGTFSISPIAGRFSLEGPVKKNTSSYIISLRRSWLDGFAILLSPAQRKAAYSFYDFNFKYNHSINANNKVTIGIYTGKDKFVSRIKFDNEKSEYGFNWGNATASFRWNTIFSSKLFATFTGYLSSYDFNQKSETTSNFSKQIQKVESKIIDRALQSDFEYAITSKNKIRFGSKLSLVGFAPEILQVAGAEIDTVINQQAKLQSLNAELYGEQDSKLSNKFLLNVGLRTAIYIPKNKTYLAFQPRLSLTYLMDKNSSLKFSFNKMAQFLHLLTNSSIGFPVDLWVPSTEKTSPEQSVQYAIGFNQRFPTKNLEASVEVYYKTMNNLLEYRDGANYLFGSTNWEEKVIYGKGRSYGAEFFVNKKKGIITGWISYTLSFTVRQFNEINNGHRFPFKYDRRHDVSVYGSYELRKNKSLSAVFVLSSGNLATIPVSNFKGSLPPNFNLTPRYQSGNFPNDFVNQELVDKRNNYRLPLYHRLDLNYQISKTTKRNNKRTFLFSIYNAYSRLNPFLIYQSEGKLKKLTLFPIIPSINYKLDF